MTRIEFKEGIRTLIEKAKKDNALPATLAMLARHSLFFLLVYILNRKDADTDFVFERCNQVQAKPDGFIDLWAREHYKSTIITFALTIQDIINDPEITIGIFSHTKGIAKSFLKQIKFELESNIGLQELFPEVFYANPVKESRCWSLDNGITVKREGNPKEATVEAWGLVDGQPTSKHYKRLIYDDIVTVESVTTSEQIQKTTEAWSMSLNLASKDTIIRYVGTRYHLNDTYAEIIKRGAAKQRVTPATEDGKVEGTPVLMSVERLAQKYRDMGSYIFSCHSAGTLITMSDWSHKPIEQLVAGDEVVGWTMDNGRKAKLTPTKIITVSKRENQGVVESRFEDGSKTIHTPDHKWWTGRVADKEGKEQRPRKIYSELGLKYNNLKYLCKVVDLSVLNEELSDEQKNALGYLAGIIDGEGGVKHKVVQISQDCILNPKVCEKIEWCLKILKIDYSIWESFKKNRNGKQRVYTVLGGRQTRIRLLNLLGSFIGKKDHIVNQCYSTRVKGKDRVKLISQSPEYIETVYNIQTETGNYIANGFCSKNCQMLLNPVEDQAQGFKKEWLQFWHGTKWAGYNRYILVDPAGEKKKTNDYTVMAVVGLGKDKNFYLIHGVRDRLNLAERGRLLMHLVREYKPVAVGYEKYGIQADIEYVKELQDRENYRFKIIELGGSMAKNDRIRRLIPLFEEGRFFIPAQDLFVDNKGKQQNFTNLLMDEEYYNFPVSSHDDMLDCIARIKDPALRADFPYLESKELYNSDKPAMAVTEYDILKGV